MKPSLTRPFLAAALVALPASAALAPSGWTPVASAADAPAAPAAPPAAPAKRALDPKEREKLVPLLRGYLDVENPDGFKARTQLVDALKKLRESGTDVLADRESLMGLIYPARAYAPAFEKALVKGDKESRIDLDPSTNIVAVSWGELRLSVSLPTGYEEARKGKKLPTLAPYPAVVTLHDLEDFMNDKGQQKDPGSEVIKRRWPRKASKVPEGWLMFAPVVTRAQFVKQDGKLDMQRIPLRELWTRYHVDVDRIVVEGGSDAVALAASQPHLFAGLVVRNADKADVSCPELVRNLSTLSIYVVGSPDAPLVKSLEAGGFPKERLKVGGAEGLPDWLASKELRRVVPKSFRWTVRDADMHSFAHWVNIEQVEGSDAAPPRLAVEVVDTAEAPNTIRITSSGIRSVSLFLSDELVDLNREVKLVVNATPVREVKIHSPRNAEGLAVRLPAKFDAQRTLDNVFDLMPEFWPRRRMYYGWLFPLTFMKVPVRTDRDEKAGEEKPGGGAPPAPTTPADPAAELREKNAQRYLEKAKENEEIGDLKKALVLYRKAVDEGESSVKATAEAKVKELEAKVGGDAPPR